MTHYDLSLAWSAIVIFALCMYIMLDGFDLGVGILLLAETEEINRDVMVRSIAPVWDGNETWIVLVGVALLGGFPLAYSVLLPAFYLPIIGMLLCLAFRGTAFEFRFQTVKYRHLWDLTFGAGSIGAALLQGMVIGRMASGLSLQNEGYATPATDFISPFSIFAGIGLICAYAMLGSLWLSYRIRGELQLRTAKYARVFVCCFVFFAWACFGLGPHVVPSTVHVWSPVGAAAVSIIVALLGLLCIWQHRIARRLTAFLLGIVMLLTLAVSVVLTFWPFVIPYKLTIWQAASPENSQIVLLIGVSIAIPIILAYSAFAYYVFRGPVTPEDPDPVNYLKELESDAKP